MFQISNLLNLSFHVFGHGIKLLDFILKLKTFNLLNSWAYSFGKEDIFLLFLILIIFGLRIFLQKFNDIG